MNRLNAKAIKYPLDLTIWCSENPIPKSLDFIARQK